MGVRNGEVIRLVLPPAVSILNGRFGRERVAGTGRGDRRRLRLQADDRLSRARRAGGVQAGGDGIPRLGI